MERNTFLYVVKTHYHSKISWALNTIETARKFIVAKLLTLIQLKDGRFCDNTWCFHKTMLTFIFTLQTYKELKIDLTVRIFTQESRFSVTILMICLGNRGYNIQECLLGKIK